MIRLPRIFYSFTFRLALVYVSLFSVSVVLLFAFIYTFAQNYTEAQVASAIRTQYSHLLSAYKQNGSTGVEARIRQLIAEDDEGKEIYLLTNREYEKLAGNLNTWPKAARPIDDMDKEGKWVSFYIESARNTPSGIEVRAFVIPLSKWRFLLVGQSTQQLLRIEQIILQTFWASLLVTLVMALLGALVMTRSVIKRINVINRSAHLIIHGDLAARIPYTQAGDEFDELSSNLNRMLDKIAMLMQSIGLFANNIAHDLRSPLNRIINRLDEGLRHVEKNNPARDLLAQNQQEMEGLIATFNSILNISELEFNAQFREFSAIDLGQAVADLVEFYEPIATEKNIMLTNRLPASMLVRGEKHLLTQAFANLIDNAIKFTPSGGEVSIYCEGEDVIIADTGEGIPTSYRDKVFEKFFRMEESRHTQGNGLGLSLVAAIARIHKVNIILEDNQPTGLLVRFRLKPF